MGSGRWQDAREERRAYKSLIIDVIVLALKAPSKGTQPAGQSTGEVENLSQCQIRDCECCCVVGRRVGTIMLLRG